MQPCNRIYYSTIHWRLNMFRAAYRLKHIEPSMNGGIINSVTGLHLVGYFCRVLLQCTDPWILNSLFSLHFFYFLSYLLTVEENHCYEGCFEYLFILYFLPYFWNGKGFVYC
jgi:hypothetical protein